MNRRIGLLSGFVLVAIAGCSDTPSTQNTSAAEPTVIDLTQTGCQFLEVENQDYGYTPTNAEQCKEINAATIRDRTSTFQPLELTAGEYLPRLQSGRSLRTRLLPARHRYPASHPTQSQRWRSHSRYNPRLPRHP